MAYGDGGFFFLQPVNNGYGGIEAAPSYGRSMEVMQHPSFTLRHQIRPAHSAVSSTGNGNGNNGANNGVLSAEAVVQIQVEKLKTNLAKATSALTLVRGQEVQSYALLSSLPSDATGARGAQLKELSKLRQKAIGLVTAIRGLEMELITLTGNKFDLSDYPQFKEFPTLMGEELITDVVDDEMMLPDQEAPLSPPPDAANVDFFAKNEKTIMIVAGAVGAYALLRMLR